MELFGILLGLAIALMLISQHSTSQQQTFRHKNRSLEVELKSVSQQLMNTRSNVHWSSSLNKPLNRFKSNAGQAMLYFFHNSKIETKTSISQSNYLKLMIYDPKYIDGNVISLFISLEDIYNSTMNGWNGQTSGYYDYYFQSTKIQSQVVVGNITVNINSTSGNISAQNLLITYEKYQPQIKITAPWSALIPVFVMYFCINKCKELATHSQKISITSITIIITYLMVLSIIQTYKGASLNAIAFTPQRWWTFTGLLTLMVIFKFAQVFQHTIRRVQESLCGYIKFYFFSGIYMILLLLYALDNWFILLNTLWMIPQIVHSAHSGTRPIFSIYYMIAVFSGQLYPLYAKGCPQNLLLQTPNYSVVFGILVLIILQVLIIYGQSKFGSRFMIPRRFLPNYYQYFHSLEIDINNGLTFPECSICLSTLQYPDPNQIPMETISEQRNNEQKNIIKVKVMKTPCGHLFHEKCLKDWMDIRLECPQDRTAIPPFQ